MSAEQYINYVTLKYLQSGEFDLALCGRWIEENQFRDTFADSVRVALRQYEYEVPNAYSDLTDTHWNGLVDAGALLREGDEFTGYFYLCRVQKKDEYVRIQLANLPVSQRISTLGDQALLMALSRVAEQENWRRGDPDADDNVFAAIDDVAQETAPASDRIVTFSDNQIVDLADKATDVIAAIEAKNQLGEEPGLRELIVGQLKAGRELIRAGSCRLYLLELTLIQTLRWISQRYEKEVVGGLAAALITALVKQIGIDA